MTISDKISILYKAPGHNAEITSLSWCPDLNNEYLDNVSKISKTPKDRKFIKPHSKKSSSIQDRLNRIQSDDENQPQGNLLSNTEISNSKSIKNNSSNENLNAKTPINGKEVTSDDFLSECKKTLNLIENSEEISFQEDASPTKSKNEKLLSAFDEYGRSKYLPKLIDDKINDTFEKSILETTVDSEANIDVADESDIFDIYADHEIEEFGHKKNILNENENIFIKETPTKNTNVTNTQNNLNESQINDLSLNISTLKLENENEKTKVSMSVSEKNSDSFYLASCCKKGYVFINLIVFLPENVNVSKLF